MSGSFKLRDDTNTTFFSILNDSIDGLCIILVSRAVRTLLSKLGISLGFVREGGRIEEMPVENIHLVPRQSCTTLLINM